jgi:RimJ/RimL family protein N-acetyltransferase
MKLTKATEADIPILETWLKDDSIMGLIQLEPLNTALPFLIYLIRLDDDTPVGYVTLYNIDTERGNADAGIVIPEKKGRGLSLSAGRILLGWAFSEDLALERVRLKVLKTNRVARRLAELFGFTEEGVERKAAIHNGKREDVYIYGLLKSEFEGGMRNGGNSSSCTN